MWRFLFTLYCALAGSSNDVLEFKAKEGLPPVDLRSGPKSYTFGGFAKMLEMFHFTMNSKSQIVSPSDLFDNIHCITLSQ